MLNKYLNTMSILNQIQQKYNPNQISRDKQHLLVKVLLLAKLEDSTSDGDEQDHLAEIRHMVEDLLNQ